MAGRSPARFLAPILLLAFAFALYTVIHNAQKPAGTDASSNTPTATATKTSSHTSSSKHHKHTTHKPTTYTVKSGDTLSGIAAKTGVSTTTLEKLNPHLEPQALSPGQHLKLRK
jgi:LysM repeat protein